MKVAIIPARGGSKRIPRKNIKFFCGKPMVAWSIEAAMKCTTLDRIIVSTDDEEISEIVQRYGAEAPFVRPKVLSGDHVGTTEVVAHAIDWLNRQGTRVDFACCIYATAPFVCAMDIEHGLASLIESSADYAFAVTSYPSPIQRAIRLTSNGRVEMLNPSQFNTRTQDLEEVWHDAAQFYWGRADAWLSGRPIFSSGATPVFLPRYRVQDIDTPDDWVRAEWLFKSMRESRCSMKGGI